MIENENALDTLFGGVILILICVICSINLIILSSVIGDTDDYPSKEGEFDYVLGSEICISSAYDVRMILYDYILQMHQINESGINIIFDNVSQIQQEICSLIEFYYYPVEGWILSVVIDGEEKIIAQSVKNTLDCCDIIVHNRVLGGGSYITEISLNLYR